jgi:hypothetical protein
MQPDIAHHRNIEIRYGYAASDDRYHAHFDLPEQRQVERRFPTAVQTNSLSVRLKPGKAHVFESTEERVLDKARTEIDRFLDG